MQVIRGTDALSRQFLHPVVALGNFDGVHRGHQVLIRKVVERAREAGGTAMVVTFDPHPQKVLSPATAPPLLTTLETKLRVLEELGIQVVVCIPFTPAFSTQGPEEFIEEVLVRRIGVREAVVGPNYAFGKGRQGNVARLIELGERWKFRVWVVESMMLEGERVSSSMIRGYLKNGDVERGADYLGREYLVEGVVVPGHQRGGKLGYPTANLAKIPEMLPKEGVYAVRVDHASKLLDAIAYVGSQPTFHGKEVGLEVHLLNFTGQIYQERLRVYFVAWLRPERVFESQEALVAQIRKDVETARGILQSPRRRDSRT